MVILVSLTPVTGRIKWLVTTKNLANYQYLLLNYAITKKDHLSIKNMETIFSLISRNELTIFKKQFYILKDNMNTYENTPVASYRKT